MRSINSSGVRCSSSLVYLLHCAYLAARFAQPLQARAVVRCYANAGVYRETAVLVAQHLFGLETLEQTAPNKGAQDAPAQAGLRLAHGIRIRIHIHASGWVKDDTRRLGTDSTHWRTGRRRKTWSLRWAPSRPCAACCTRGTRPGPCRRRPPESRARSLCSGRGQSHGRRCRIPGTSAVE